MIFDVFMFNGEFDVLEIRLNILNDYVDKFIIVEAPVTFSGNKKPLYFLEQEKRFEKWLPKIKYYVVDVDDPILWEMARKSPNTEYGKGASHWLREFVIKESIKKALIGLDDEDVCFISDCDEIWNPETLTKIREGTYRLRQKMYVYYLNMRSSEEWAGTLLAKYRHIKDACLNHLRTDKHEIIENDGWHFSSVGGVEELRRKLNDSYTAESNNSSEVQAKLADRYGKEDFLGRPFNWVYTVDDSSWPQFLKDNREKYKDLCKLL